MRTSHVMGLISTLALAFSGAGCDLGHAVSYENETNESIDVFINGRFSASLDSVEKKTFDKIEFSKVTYEARDSTGRVLYRETLT